MRRIITILFVIAVCHTIVFGQLVELNSIPSGCVTTDNQHNLIGKVAKVVTCTKDSKELMYFTREGKPIYAQISDANSSSPNYSGKIYNYIFTIDGNLRLEETIIIINGEMYKTKVYDSYGSKYYIGLTFTNSSTSPSKNDFDNHGNWTVSRNSNGEPYLERAIYYWDENADEEEMVSIDKLRMETLERNYISNGGETSIKFILGMGGLIITYFLLICFIIFIVCMWGFKYDKTRTWFNKKMGGDTIIEKERFCKAIYPKNWKTIYRYLKQKYGKKSARWYVYYLIVCYGSFIIVGNLILVISIMLLGLYLILCAAPYIINATSDAYRIPEATIPGYK